MTCNVYEAIGDIKSKLLKKKEEKYILKKLNKGTKRITFGIKKYREFFNIKRKMTNMKEYNLR